MQRNVAGQVIGAQMVNSSTGAPFTGAVTVYVTLDGGTQAVGTVGAGAATHEGNGYQTYAPSQAETDGALLAYTFIGTGAIPVTVQVFTRLNTNVTHVNGGATDGYNATLKLKQLDIENNAGTAMRVVATGGNGNGMHVIGTGTGDGIRAESNGGNGSAIGAYADPAGEGHGLAVIGGGVGGSGLYAVGGGELLTGGVGDGITAFGGGEDLSGTGNGIAAFGAGAAHGVKAIGGDANGNGFFAEALTAGWAGIFGKGLGTGPGILGRGGATGPGIMGEGGATSGSGLYLEATDGNAIEGWAGGDNSGANFNGSGAGGSGMRLTGAGTGDGLRAIKGGSGIDIKGDLSASANNAIADAVLLRDWAAIVATVPARCVLNALRHIRNFWEIVGTTKTVYKEDDVTPAWTSTVVPSAGANPIISDIPD
jgi:hypothetical protein